MSDSMLEGILEEPEQLASRRCQRRDKVVTFLSNFVLIEEFSFPPIFCSLKYCMLSFFILALDITHDIYAT